MNSNHKGLIVLVVINIIISGTIFLLPAHDQLYIIYKFAYSNYSAFYSAITYSVIHSSVNHLSTNMLFLAAYGYFLEPLIGTKKFLWLYGVAAILSVVVFQLIVDLPIPCVGASGAVCAILGASLFLKKIPNVLTILLLFFIVTETAKSFMGIQDGVAHLAHTIGFVIGILFMPINYGKTIFTIRR